jgi:hypothetical protein
MQWRQLHKASYTGPFQVDLREVCLEAIDALEGYPTRMTKSEALIVWAISYDCEEWVAFELRLYLGAAARGREISSDRLIHELREQVLNASDRQVAGYVEEGDV